MTENEAIENINALNAVCWQKDFYDEEFEESLEIAIEALSEIQQYRAIGTVEELKTAMLYVSLAKIHGTVGRAIDACAEYESIGTIEEFKALKEKNEPKNAIGKRKYDEAYCPACNEVISDGEFWALDEYVHHCNYCGKAVKGVDWSE